MLRLFILFAVILLSCCSSSTGPSYGNYSKITVIDTQTGSIESEIDLHESGVYRIAISPDGSYLYAMQYWRDDVIKIDCASLTVTDSLDIQGYDWMITLCLNSAGSRLCAVFDNDLYFLGTDPLAITDSVTSITQGIDEALFQPGSELVYCAFNEIGQGYGGFVVADAAQGVVADTLELGFNFSEPVFSVSGSDLYVLSGNSIRRLDPNTGTQLAEYDHVEILTDISVNTSTDVVHVSWAEFEGDMGGVLSLDASTLSPLDSLSIDEGIYGLCHVPSINYLYADYISGGEQYLLVIDETVMEELYSIHIPDGLRDMAADPSGQRLYCSVDRNVDQHLN